MKHTTHVPGQMLARWPMVKSQTEEVMRRYDRRRPNAAQQPLLRGPRRSSVSTLPLLIGRAIFGGFFLYNGINHFLNRRKMADYTRGRNVPAADLAVVASGAMLTLGGLSILSGAKPRLGASLIAGFLAGVTPVMHAFWKDEDEQQRMNDLVHFSKNLALLGGAALAASIPRPWPASLGGAA